jgi:hypothetical protein
VSAAEAAANAGRGAAAILWWARRRDAAAIKAIYAGLSATERQLCVEAIRDGHLSHLNDRQLEHWLTAAASKTFNTPGS